MRGRGVKSKVRSRCTWGRTFAECGSRSARRYLRNGSGGNCTRAVSKRASGEATTEDVPDDTERIAFDNTRAVGAKGEEEGMVSPRRPLPAFNRPRMRTDLPHVLEMRGARPRGRCSGRNTLSISAASAPSTLGRQRCPSPTHTHP